MTEQRRHLTTEDFAAREPLDRERTDQADGRDAVGQEAAGPMRTDQVLNSQDTAGYEQTDRTADGHDATGYPRTDQTAAGHDAAEHAQTDPTTGRQDTTGHTATNQTAAGQDTAGRTWTDGEPSRDGYDPAGREGGGYEASEREAGEPADRPADHDSFPERDEPVELSAVSATAGDAPLFTGDQAADYQAEWRALQADFVDEPREAVRRADELVAQVMQTLATTFAQHKDGLEEQWREGGEAQTEELRQALKRYRAFFDRLLSV